MLPFSASRNAASCRCIGYTHGRSMDRKRKNVLTRLPEYDVHNHLCPHSGIQIPYQQRPAHRKLLTQDGRRQMHIKHLILDIQILCISDYHRTYNVFPRLNQPVFIKRRLQSFLPEQTPDNIAHLLRIVPFHASASVRKHIRPPLRITYNLRLLRSISYPNAPGWYR